jgi:hypothetical protein
MLKKGLNKLLHGRNKRHQKGACELWSMAQTKRDLELERTVNASTLHLGTGLNVSADLLQSMHA